MSSPLASTLCAIPGTSEGVGIGARVVIYTQTLLFFTTALWILWNGKVTQGGLDHARSQLATSLFFPLAILISSLISASNLNFTNYDGVIALSLSLISSASSFAYLILFIHHKVGLRNGQGRVDASWKAWGRNLLEAYSGRRYVYHLVGFLDEPTFAGKTISSHASGGDAELGTSPIQQTPVGGSRIFSFTFYMPSPEGCQVLRPRARPGCFSSALPLPLGQSNLHSPLRWVFGSGVTLPHSEA